MRITTSLTLAVATALLPTVAAAEGLFGRPLFMQAALRACGADAARLCADVAPGGGRIAQCLLDQERALGPDCRAFMARTRSAQGAILACAADTERHCAGVPPGGGRVVACLSAKRDVISDACARALDDVSASFGR